jgi:hypothetical protein
MVICLMFLVIKMHASILHASAENKLVMHVSSRSDELHLLSSLHTLVTLTSMICVI